MKQLVRGTEKKRGAESKKIKALESAFWSKYLPPFGTTLGYDDLGL